MLMCWDGRWTVWIDQGGISSKAKTPPQQPAKEELNVVLFQFYFIFFSCAEKLRLQKKIERNCKCCSVKCNLWKFCSFTDYSLFHKDCVKY